MKENVQRAVIFRESGGQFTYFTWPALGELSPGFKIIQGE
jgi:hypothetical protein